MPVQEHKCLAYGKICCQRDEYAFPYGRDCAPVLHQLLYKTDCVLQDTVRFLPYLVQHDVNGILHVGNHSRKSPGLHLLHVGEYAPLGCNPPEYLLYILECHHPVGYHLEDLAHGHGAVLNLGEVCGKFSEYVDTGFTELTEFRTPQIVRCLYLSVGKDKTRHVHTETCGHVREHLGGVVKFLVLYPVCGKFLGICDEFLQLERGLHGKLGYLAEQLVCLVLVLHYRCKRGVLQFELSPYLGELPHILCYLGHGEDKRETAHQLAGDVHEIVLGLLQRAHASLYCILFILEVLISAAETQECLLVVLAGLVEVLYRCLEIFHSLCPLVICCGTGRKIHCAFRCLPVCLLLRCKQLLLLLSLPFKCFLRLRGSPLLLLRRPCR